MSSQNRSAHTEKEPPKYGLGEEIVNSVTHGVGAVLAVIGLIMLILYAGNYRDIWRVVGFSVFGASLFMLYLSSTLYHAFPNGRIKHFLRLMDHSAIFMLIAGTYTPVLLVAMRGPWGWTLFGLIWTLALVGLIFELAFLGRFKKISLAIYIGMGWLAVIAVKPMLTMLPEGLLIYIVAGGLLYTTGIVFYVSKRLPYHHAIWHVFVLAGSVLHFLGLLFYLPYGGVG
ncbi:MAG: hemolysin III family protein [Desulfobacterales bacterium]|nr:hemolysin III family protein [Desulfobacterales bacterium]